MKFILHSEINAQKIAGSLGSPEYSYYFVLKEFLPVLNDIGDVVVVDHFDEVDQYYDRALSQNEKCVFLSFSPPNKTPMALRCPTIPVFAWEFDTIPNERWLDESHQDWCYSLAHFGAAITHSQFTVDAVKKELGKDYPIFSIPAPVWDKYESLRASALSAEKKTEIKLRVTSGIILDTRDVSLAPFMPNLDTIALTVAAELRKQGVTITATSASAALVAKLPVRTQSRWLTTRRYLGEWYLRCARELFPRLPDPRQRQHEMPAFKIVPPSLARMEPLNQVEPAMGSKEGVVPCAPSWKLSAGEVTLDGVVFTSLFNPYDGRKNWADMLTAFCAAFRDTPDATLVFKLGSVEYQSAMEAMMMYLARMPPFKCRVVLIQGYLNGSDFEALIEATNFVVNASYGEGQCLPLMEFLSCGKPAVAPRHSALTDYIDTDLAFVVDSWLDVTAWPHDPRLAYRTLRHQIDWESLVAAYQSAYQCFKEEPQRYQEMSRNAIRRMQSHCSQEAARNHLRAFQQLITGPEFAAPVTHDLEQISAQNCGLVDAVQSGWYQNATDELFTGFPVGAQDVVVDVGCGAGGATLFCANRGAHVIFTDTMQESVDAVRQRVALTPARKSEGIVSDSCPLPLPDACATRVMALEMLEHVEDPAQVIRELVRIGQPGALYLISVPDPVGEKIQTQIAPSIHFQRPNHIRIFEREDFDKLVEKAGLEVLSKSYSGFFWTMWILIYWTLCKTNGTELQGATLDAVTQHAHPPLLDSWAKMWHTLIKMPESRPVKQALDELLPKSQIIVARKPHL